MKKLLLWILIMLTVLSMVLTGGLLGCKTTTAAETTAAATTAAATTAAATTAAATTAAAETKTEEIVISKIGYSTLTTQMEYFQRVILGMQLTCKKNNIELLLDDPQLDLDKQLTGLENLLTSGAQALVICSLDPVAVGAAVDEAHAKNIPVISHVSTFENADCYVSLKESEWGMMLGTTFGEELKKIEPDMELKMAVLSADSLGEGLLQRVQGELDGIMKSYPDAKVIARSDAFDEATALTTVETMLQANPDINVIVCSNDPGAYGAISAVEGAGKELNKDIYICTGGDQFKTLDMVEQGKILISAEAGPEKTGVLMVENAIKLIKGEEVPLNSYMDLIPITKDNVKQVREFKLSFGPME
jgi:ribose transport system substrate-binding protein